MYIIKKIILLACAGFLLLSCSLLEREPQVIEPETYYESESAVLHGLAGVYGVINSAEFYGNYYSIVASNIDDLCYFNRAMQTNYFEYNRHNAGTSQIYEMWAKIYEGVNNANAYIEAMRDNSFDPYGRYGNEARFLRAYYHFILAQAWGDVPLRDSVVSSYGSTSCAATSQFKILEWAASEMEACAGFFAGLYAEHPEFEEEDLSSAPSRICASTVHGILARVYLFMAGESVRVEGEQVKEDYYRKAMEHAKTVIDSGRHTLNPVYSDVFVNMISDRYDREYRESIWEADFKGDRTSADNWSNGRIGDLLGLYSGGNSTDYAKFNCNYAYGKYNGSLKLWDLYWTMDRTDDEDELEEVTDSRQEWNMPPYNYQGSNTNPPYKSGLATGSSLAGIDKTPYKYGGVSTSDDPTAAQAVRNCGKFRREVVYEGQKTAKNLYTSINFPILRYSDVLLMYAEASNELNGVSQEAYDCVKMVRDRAGIKTKDMGTYGKSSFRTLVRNERGRELCFESLRKYDLIRWGIYVREMNDYGKWTADDRWSKSTALASYAADMGDAVKQMHVFLPIPSIELGVNTLLVQNPLW